MATTQIVNTNSLTIVSAFIAQINTRNDRPIQKYIDLGKSLIRLNVRQIVFLERAIYERHFCELCDGKRSDGKRSDGELCDGKRSDGELCDGKRSDGKLCLRDHDTEFGHFDYGEASFTYIVHGNTTFVLFERSDMYLHAYRYLATEFSVHTPHPQKDTLDYMFVQCTKTEWVAMAIALDRYKRRDGKIVSSDGMYAWLDFGIRHMYPSDTAMETSIYRFRDRLLSSKWWDRALVYAPSCWDPAHVNIHRQDVFGDVFWVFSGSAFGGSADALLDFASRMKQKCVFLLATRRSLMWEVNVWYLVYRDCPERFALFYGNHNSGILDNWLAVDT